MVDYAFLSDFDLLQDARQDIHEKPWSSHTNRVLCNQYFKLERAREEIKRLNVEIRRVVTYINDETDFLRAKEANVTQDNPILAHQIFLYQTERGRAHGLHMERFRKLSKHSGFTGNITPGQSIHLSTSVPQKGKQVDRSAPSVSDIRNADNDDTFPFVDDDDDDVDDEDLDEITYRLLMISTDDETRSPDVQQGMEGASNEI